MAQQFGGYNPGQPGADVTQLAYQQSMADPASIAKTYTDIQNKQYGGVDPAVLAQMNQRAMGQGPSMAELLMRSGVGQAQRGMYGLAAGAGGVSPALALRGAEQQSGALALNMMPQYGAAGIQEQNAARGQLLQYIQNQQAAEIARQQMLAQLAAARYSGETQQSMQTRQQQMDLIGGVMQGTATAGTMYAMKP